MDLAAIGPDPDDPTRAYTTVHGCPTCGARPARLCHSAGLPVGRDHMRYTVHVDRPTVRLPHLDPHRGVPTVAGWPAEDVAAALEHRRHHGGYTCRVPRCDHDARVCFAAAAHGVLASRTWQPGDLIDLCATHVGDLHRVIAGDDTPPLWLHADLHHPDRQPTGLSIAGQLGALLGAGPDDQAAEASAGAEESPAELPEHLDVAGSSR